VIYAPQSAPRQYSEEAARYLGPAVQLTALPGRKRKTSSRTATVVVLLLAAIWIFPIYWMFVSAFKPIALLETYPPQFLPSIWTLANFQLAFNGNPVISQPGFFGPLLVSVIVSVVVVAFSVAFGLLAATAVARFRFIGRGTLLVLLLVFQMVPFEALLIPIFLELDQFNLVYTIPALIIAYIAPALPFTIWMLNGFVAAIPRDIEEAAMTDGCSRMTAFWKVLFPLIAPGLVATSIFAFILAWNEFAFANVLTNNGDQTLAVWLYSSINPSVAQIQWGELMAVSLLFSLPVMVFFMLIQRRLAAGLTAGAVKG
jgi:N,N'-diacetylchitobiose transport system permease protein